MSTKAEYHRLRERCASDGICLRCRQPREGSHSKWHCLSCLEKNKQYDANKRAKKAAAGLCACGQVPVSGMKSCEDCLKRGIEYQQCRRANNLKNGACITCGKPPISGSVTCAICSNRATIATLKRYTDRKKDHVCPFCGDDVDDMFRCKRCHVNHLDNSRMQWLHRRTSVLNHYGHTCECCKCNDYKFLEIDHIAGGGAKHRKIIGSHIINWAIKNEFPDGLQVLCANCNRGKGKFGTCPHLQPPTNPQSRTAIVHRQHRLECIEHYGGKCVFCGESNWAFLEFDHINDDGRFNRHSHFPRWLIRNNFPADIQLLCCNCNKAKGLYGYQGGSTEDST